MADQLALDQMYMGMAKLSANLSKARRAKVGAILVTQHGVVLQGYNGTAPGYDNNCEEVVFKPDDIVAELVTKPDVIHAELNAILKAAKEGVSTIGSTMYLTLSPCLQCSAMMKAAGVKRVVYSQAYRDLNGAEKLLAHGVKVEQFAQI